MNEMTFTIDVKAPKEKVWNTLWQDRTFRQWAGIIDPGTYMVGELAEGHDIQFLSGNGYGVTSFVECLTPNEYLLLRHKADTQNNGKQERDKEWSGGKEVYTLTEKDGITTLNILFYVPPNQKKYFTDTYPKAMDVIKFLSENN